MADFVSLTCPNCGGKLEITPDLKRFACAYCGAEHIVKRGGGIVALAPVAEAIGKVQVGVDRTTSELAIKRLKDEIAALEISKGDFTTPSVALVWGGMWSFAIFALLVLGWMILTGFDWTMFWLFLIFCGLAIWLDRSYTGRQRDYQRRIAPIQEQINQRLTEIKRHKQIVSTPPDGKQS